MDLITVDLETYYDKEFSLSKITTEEYIRSSLFEVIGIGVKLNDEPTQWASGTHEELKRWLQKSFRWDEAFVLAHNTFFDGAILRWRFDINPRGWLDTLCMGRALHGVEVGGSLKALAERYNLGQKGTEVLNAIGKRRLDFSPEELARYGDYCVNDVELTHKLFNVLMRTFPKQELRVIDQTLRMFIDPVLELDAGLLESHLRTVQLMKEDLLAAAGVDKADLMSNEKFAEVLRGLGVTPPMKVSPTTGKQAYAFAKNDEEFKALAEHPDPRVQAVVAARLGNKSTLEETRTQRFIEIAQRGNLPVPIKYYAAHTGRWGGADSLNLQNLPSRGKNANQLKKAIVAPPGHVIIDADSSQIEARVLAWLAGQDDVVEAFATGKDVYKKMAAAIYAIPEENITKDQRFIGKTVILGCGYGLGAAKFHMFMQQAGVTMEADEARRIIDIYRRTNDRITALWKQAQNAVVSLSRGERAVLGRPGVLELVPEEHAIRLPSGLLMRYTDLRFDQTEKGVEFHYKTRSGRTRIYGGKCLAADTEVLTPRGWVRITDVGLGDMLWDGVEWVNHCGLIYQGDKATIMLDGVRMTPDHKILTERGWQGASSCEGLRRADVRLPDGYEVCGDERTAFGVGVQVPVASEAVYDILNAGPRSRFMVRGTTGPFIVHNCIENVCQAIARCIIAEQMLRVGKRYKVVLTVHDAIAVCVPDAEAEEAQKYVESCMRWVPDWAEGLPVNCESGVGKSYGDC